MSKKSKDIIYLELKSMKEMGVSIKLEGREYEAERLAEQLTINENCSYKQNYVTDSCGELISINYKKRYWEEGFQQ